MSKIVKTGPFPSAKQDATDAELCVSSPQSESSAYKLAYLDADFMLSEELRPVRLQLELLKPGLLQQQACQKILDFCRRHDDVRRSFNVYGERL